MWVLYCIVAYVFFFFLFVVDVIPLIQESATRGLIDMRFYWALMMAPIGGTLQTSCVVEIQPIILHGWEGFLFLMMWLFLGQNLI